MLKTGEMSQDEQKKKISELAKRIAQLEIDLKKEQADTAILSKEILDQKELSRNQQAQLQKEVMHYKDSLGKLEAKVKQLEIDKNQLQQNVFKLTDTNKQLERDMLMIAPIVEEKDRMIAEQNNMIKQMKDQFESEKLKQREEYMRAFNKMKEELAMIRS